MFYHNNRNPKIKLIPECKLFAVNNLTTDLGEYCGGSLEIWAEKVNEFSALMSCIVET